MMVTCHSNKLTSSTSPAENPSTGRLVSSAPTVPLVRVYRGLRVPCTLSATQRAWFHAGEPPLSCFLSSREA